MTTPPTVPWKDLQVGDLVGHGSYGDVYRGTLNVPPWNGKTVDIKKLLLKKLSDPLKQDFDKEWKN